MMSGIRRILTVAAATSFIVGTAVAQDGIPVFAFACAAYNLVRLRNLAIQSV